MGDPVNIQQLHVAQAQDSLSKPRGEAHENYGQRVLQISPNLSTPSSSQEVICVIDEEEPKLKPFNTLSNNQPKR